MFVYNSDDRDARAGFWEAGRGERSLDDYRREFGTRGSGPFEHSGRKSKRKAHESARGAAKTLDDRAGPGGQLFMLCDGLLEERVIKLRELGLGWLEEHPEAIFSQSHLEMIHGAMGEAVSGAAGYTVEVGRVNKTVHVHVLCGRGACELGRKRSKPVTKDDFIDMLAYHRKAVPLTERNLDAYMNVLRADGRVGVRHRWLRVRDANFCLREVQEALGGAPLLSQINQERQERAEPFRTFDHTTKNAQGMTVITTYAWDTPDAKPRIVGQVAFDLDAEIKTYSESDDPTERLIAQEYFAVVRRDEVAKSAALEIKTYGSGRPRRYLSRVEGEGENFGRREWRNPLPLQYGPPLHVIGAQAPPLPA